MLTSHSSLLVDDKVIVTNTVLDMMLLGILLMLLGSFFPYGYLSQEAELYALLWACALAKDKTANIYTDQRYVVHALNHWSTGKMIAFTNQY